jgi:hypothetical protein
LHPDDLAAIIRAIRVESPGQEGRGTIVLAPVPRIALSMEEAAKALGIGRTCFNERVGPEMKKLRVGDRVLISVEELERYAREKSQRAP